MKKTIPVHDNVNPNTPLDPDEMFFIRKRDIHTGINEEAIPPLHRHPFYEMVFVVHGEGTFKLDFKEYPLKRGSMYLCSPGQTHTLANGYVNQGYLLHFEVPIFQEKRFLDNISIFNFDFLYFDESEYLEMESLLANLYEEFNQNRELKEMTISNLLKLLLIKVQRNLPDVVNSPTQTTLFNALNERMKENEYKVISASEYAKELKVPIHTLNAAIKEYTGMTIAGYIRSKTMIEIKRLLYYTELNTSEISWQLGFVDPGYFSRFFKREAGMSPTEFRKNNNNALKSS